MLVTCGIPQAASALGWTTAATMDLAAAELEAAIQRIVDARRQLRAGRLPGVLEDE